MNAGDFEEGRIGGRKEIYTLINRRVSGKRWLYDRGDNRRFELP